MKHNRYILAMVTMAGLLCFGATAVGEGLVRVEIHKGQMIRLDQVVSSVIIADPTTADVQVVSPKLLFVHGKKVGETSIYAVNSQDETIYNATIEVTHNLSKLEQTVKRVAPDADVDFRTVDGGLVIDGYAPTAAASEDIRSVASAFIGANDKMVNMVKTAGSDQVTLQVKIVEMSRSDVKSLGINLSAALNPSNMAVQILQGADIAFGSDGLLNRDDGNRTSILGQWTRGNSTVTGFIDALESQGLVNVLAEPTLTTASGKAASFLAGGEFPITINSGNNTISVSYRPFGVSLNFTPVVMSKDRISITVAPEVSSISFDNPVTTSGINNPIILTRKASATVELGSGQTFALAGLLKNDQGNSVDKFPALGDMPVLGALFRSQNFQNNQTELVILVTPYVVRPVSNKVAMQTPVDGYVPPSDLQRVLMGNLYQQEPMAEEDMPKLHGEGGYILE
jgi:pilus assembly protein CpaC